MIWKIATGFCTESTEEGRVYWATGSFGKVIDSLQMVEANFGSKVKTEST
jgi:hypothetical protein